MAKSILEIKQELEGRVGQRVLVTAQAGRNVLLSIMGYLVKPIQQSLSFTLMRDKDKLAGSVTVILIS